MSGFIKLLADERKELEKLKKEDAENTSTATNTTTATQPTAANKSIIIDGYKVTTPQAN